ncbi:hypothetical protein [Streptomyces sp. WAC00263]|uniref:hypothetical protein n=1 Tax=Streptomyces sp. WAC00263 TaxID=1917422 RepID=UPI0015EE9198|nr:hypothetical protein [Streptomyces sp. WAC00263]
MLGDGSTRPSRTEATPLAVPAGRPGGKVWEGAERAVAAFPGVREPALRALHDRTCDGHTYRGELSAFVDEPLLFPDPVLRDELDLPDRSPGIRRRRPS